jgi:hypothetical protein
MAHQDAPLERAASCGRLPLSAVVFDPQITVTIHVTDQIAYRKGNLADKISGLPQAHFDQHRRGGRIGRQGVVEAVLEIVGATGGL